MAFSKYYMGMVEEDVKRKMWVVGGGKACMEAKGVHDG